MKNIDIIKEKPFNLELVLQNGKLLPKYELFNKNGQLVATVSDIEIALKIRKFYNNTIQIKNKSTNQFMEF